MNDERSAWMSYLYVLHLSEVGLLIKPRDSKFTLFNVSNLEAFKLYQFFRIISKVINSINF